METLITSAESSTEEQRKQCIRVITDATEKATRTQLDELHRAGTLTKANTQQVLAAGNRIAMAVAKTVKAELAEIVSGRIGCLRRIFSDKKFVIGPTNGTETLASASDIFGDNIDADFKNWGCHDVEKPTAETEGVPFEMCENGNYAKIFGSFGLNPERLCWTTPQIKSWVATHAASTLREDGWAAFLFLFKVKVKETEEKDRYFVAYVSWRAGGCHSAHVNRFSYESVWVAEYRCRVVVPQQALVT